MVSRPPTAVGPYTPESMRFCWGEDGQREFRGIVQPSFTPGPLNLDGELEPGASHERKETDVLAWCESEAV